jgi:hypothetical protein
MEPFDEFFELHEIAASNEHLKEDIEENYLMEMSKLTKKNTGLPVDIWIDEGRTFTRNGHEKRIKFQGDKSDPDTHNWIPLTVSDNPEIPIKNVKHDLTEQELNTIKLFVVTNLDILLKHGNEIGIIEFVKKMKSV